MHLCPFAYINFDSPTPTPVGPHQQKWWDTTIYHQHTACHHDVPYNLLFYVFFLSNKSKTFYRKKKKKGNLKAEALKVESTGVYSQVVSYCIYISSEGGFLGKHQEFMNIL